MSADDGREAVQLALDEGCKKIEVGGFITTSWLVRVGRRHALKVARARRAGQSCDPDEVSEVGRSDYSYVAKYVALPAALEAISPTDYYVIHRCFIRGAKQRVVARELDMHPGQLSKAIDRICKVLADMIRGIEEQEIEFFFKGSRNFAD